MQQQTNFFTPTQKHLIQLHGFPNITDIIYVKPLYSVKLTGMNVSVISHMCAGTQKRFNKKTIQKLESVLEISIPDISNDAEAIIKDMEEGQTI